MSSYPDMIQILFWVRRNKRFHTIVQKHESQNNFPRKHRGQMPAEVLVVLPFLKEHKSINKDKIKRT